MTDNPPALASAPEAPASTNAPTAVLSESPTAAPTAVLSESPTAAPTVPLWPIFKTVQDSHASGDVDVTCFIQKDRLDIAATEDPTGDYFTVTPDAWVSGGYQFGCMQKDENHQCTRSCFTEDGSAPDWSNKLYLTFLAKIDGDFGEGCKPMISLTGGGWPRLSSNTLVLEDSYVDAGFLVADEWRQVVIPLEDFKTPEWSLTAIFGLYFQTCGQYGGTQPTYIISQLAVTNIEYEVLSQPPSLSPTSYVTDDPSLATHRWVHKNWYPILGEDWEPEDNTWIVASENTWPTAPSGALPSSVTVQIPQGQSVMYSGTDGVHYDKIVVEGALTIKPIDADVFLKVGTIVVEKGGALDIQTDSPNDYKIVIEIDGALNQEADPEEQLIGIVSLEGNLTISGNEVPTKMAPLGETATAGSNTLVVYEMDLSNDFAVGGELILPDTQM